MTITFLTDYGTDDEFVGVCHAVARRIAPDVPVVDLTHGIRRHDVRQGALTLANSLSYLPDGVVVAVVDPGVGSQRRAVALRCADGRVMVGPDNGVLSLAWERAGGAAEAVDISRSPHRLEPLAATFHGRDIFMPVGAHIAAGAEMLDAGEPVDVDELVTLELPQPRVEDGDAVGHALVADRFGNVSTNLTHAHLLEAGLSLGAPVEVASGGRRADAVVVQTFADVQPGAALVYEDAWGAVAVAVNRGDAAKELGLERDAELRISRR